MGSAADSSQLATPRTDLMKGPIEYSAFECWHMPAKDYFSFAVVNFLSDCTELTLCFRMSSACHRVLLSPKKIVSIFLVAHGVKGIDCKFLTGYFKSANGWG